ncbi:hypothetical protein LSCM1_07889 [Leishmania martiniquensis]|uniref:PDZ domain-containing protein n=1 Tax=Leishmania martiniquensis TaxID=1580590 RepID=A0A836HI10_9TRYP|nr:hypothetical protein LSCM1_07889 [Leishmania martiniquensis]
MTSSAPFTMAIEFAPDESCVSFTGSVTITKTTLTVFHASGSTVAFMRDPAANGRALFVGVCSIPLIQFYRHKNVITLMRGSSLLFDNAAPSMGLDLGADGDIHANTAIRDSNRSSRDDPTTWETLALHCASLDHCDRLVEVLLTRNAAEAFVPPFPMRSEAHSSRNTSTPTSVNTYHRHNDQSERASSRHSSPTLDNRHLTPTRISQRPDRNDSIQRASIHRIASQTEMSTSRSFRLPSRRENDDAVTQSSVRSSELTSRSSRLHSRRENDDPVITTTPSQSIRSVRQRVAPGRSTTYSTPSIPSSEKSLMPERRHHSSTMRRDSPASTSSHSSVRMSAHRRLAGPAEREFATAEEARSHHRSHRRDGHSCSSRQSRSPRRNGAAATADEGRHKHRRGTPRSARDTTSATSSPAPGSARRRHVSPHASAADYSASINPHSAVPSAKRSEQDAFLRSIQRLQHHRLHLMQHLHKEVVHQAYLAEEARVKAAMASAKASRPRERTNSPAGARPSVIAAEAARLREIEARLEQVEALHREAEREREEAARLRREYEWRNEELSARMGATTAAALPGLLSGTGQVSERNSSVMTPRCSSVHPTSEQLMLLPHQNGGGSTYPLAAHHGCHMPLEWVLASDPAAAPRPDDVDLSVAIIDRYVFGEEWSRIFPAHEAEARFNAQIDVCLAMKLPRRLVTITHIAVDRPGLRLTAEIHYDRAKMERDGVERRMSGCPFRFLQRLYDMRDLYDSAHNSAAALAGSSRAPILMRLSSASGRRPSTATSRQASRTLSAQRRRSGCGVPYSNSDVSEIAGDFGDDYSADAHLEYYCYRVEDRVSSAEERMAERRKRMAAELRRQNAGNVAQMEEEEGYHRDFIQLSEAKDRQAIGREARSNVKATLTTSMAHLDEEERVERAAMEVGAARQLHVLMGVHRRKLALFGLQVSEAERRRQIAAQQAQARRDLNDAMNPACAVQRKQAERRAREAEVLAGCGAAHASQQELEIAVADLEADEVKARAIIRSQAMEALLDLLFHSPAPRSKDGRRAPSHASSTLKALLGDMWAEEVAQRHQIVADERRRRALYRQDDVIKREAAGRVTVEEAEMDARDTIVDDVMALNRHQLERRLSVREQLLSILSEEQFYRKAVLSDEQDAFEVVAELFSASLKDLLTRVPEVGDDDDEDLRRRRVSAKRQAKPFHYMTFTPDDMDYPPSAALAIEGIVGCSINKNLEVVSVARPLAKAEEEDLQLQAGDMILDVAGHSLHSLSHMREVLSNRVMQIQEEAFAEFPDVPQEQLTTNPALQKYIEVLCEHHNFLVQVLRGCEIYQIIVRS